MCNKKFHGELHKSDVMKQCKTCAIKIKNQTLFWVVNGGPGSIISSLAPSPAGNPVPPNPPIIKSRDNWPGMMHPPNVRMSGPLAPPPSGSGSANMGFFPSPHKASEFQPEPRPFPGTSGRPPTSTYASSSRGGRSSSSSDSSDEDDDSLEKKVKAGAAKLAESLGGMFNEMSINPSPSGVSGPGPGPGYGPGSGYGPDPDPLCPSGFGCVAGPRASDDSALFVCGVREALIPHTGRKLSEQNKYELVRMGHLRTRP